MWELAGNVIGLVGTVVTVYELGSKARRWWDRRQDGTEVEPVRQERRQGATQYWHQCRFCGDTVHTSEWSMHHCQPYLRAAAKLKQHPVRARKDLATVAENSIKDATLVAGIAIVVCVVWLVMLWVAK